MLIVRNKETRRSLWQQWILIYLRRNRSLLPAKDSSPSHRSFFNELGFDRYAVCFVSDGKLIIEPVTPISGGEFAEQILKELIDEGYNGNELLAEFRIRQAKVRPAVEAMLEGAKNAALGIGEYETYDDVFGSEEWAWRNYAFFLLRLNISKSSRTRNLNHCFSRPSTWFWRILRLQSKRQATSRE